jgi:hypothetical protein
MLAACSDLWIRFLRAINARQRRIIHILVFASIVFALLLYAFRESAGFYSRPLSSKHTLTGAFLDRGLVLDHSRHSMAEQAVPSVEQFRQFPSRAWEGCSALDLRDEVAKQMWVGIPYVVAASIGLAPILALATARRAREMNRVSGRSSSSRATVSVIVTFLSVLFAVVITTLAAASVWNMSHVSWRDDAGYVRVDSRNGHFRITSFNHEAQMKVRFERPPSIGSLLGKGPDPLVATELTQSGFAGISHSHLGLASWTAFGLGRGFRPTTAEGWTVSVPWWYVIVPLMWVLVRLWRRHLLVRYRTTPATSR